MRSHHEKATEDTGVARGEGGLSRPVLSFMVPFAVPPAEGRSKYPLVSPVVLRGTR